MKMIKSKDKPMRAATCGICGSTFMRGYSSGVTTCPDCSGNKEKALNRPFTRDTVFLVCKWYNEGLTVKRLAALLQRSEDSIKLALEKGGIEV